MGVGPRSQKSKQANNGAHLKGRPQETQKGVQTAFLSAFTGGAAASESLSVRTTVVMAHCPANSAPGSTANLPVTTSACTLDVTWSINSPLTCNFPLNEPPMDASAQCTSPSTQPLSPMTSFPASFRLPLIRPSTRKSPVDCMSPTMSVPAKIRLLICGLSDWGLEFIKAMLYKN